LSKLYNLARVETTTTGSGTLTLGDAVVGCLTFANAGVQDGDVVSYSIVDGNNTESGHGTYASAGPTLARTTIYSSTNSGSVISLSGNAQVAITALAQDMLALQTSGILQVELYNETLGSAGNFDTDPTDLSGYDHLEINLTTRCDIVAEYDIAYMFFNNDTTATNYFYQRLGIYNGATANHAEGDIPLICEINGNSSSANDFVQAKIIILNYSGTSVNKMAQCFYSLRNNSGQITVGTLSFYWESNSAITRITIQPDGYSTQKFMAGSYCQIIGVKTVA